jgi:hypothetical protein
LAVVSNETNPGRHFLRPAEPAWSTGKMILQYARGLAILAFAAIGFWLAFWHHNDPPQPISIVALVVLAGISSWLSFLIKSRKSRN